MEVNFDGIVGPTHNYSGLSYGNIPSLENKMMVSNPKEAALQGLNKMHYLMELGIKQAVLPPHERPHLPTLRALGFRGSDREVISEAFRISPEIFYACSSSSSMWTANAATVSPSLDSRDKKVHITTANLANKFHRSIEHHTTSLVLRRIFSNPEYFIHHSILPQGNAFADEGAANHSRLCQEHESKGIQLFVYGRKASEEEMKLTQFPARHTLDTSQAISRLHMLDPDQTIFAQQNPEAINAGVFHNDVTAVSNENVFFYHEKAYANSSQVIAEITEKSAKYMNLILIPVANSRISLQDAVKSYMFNSQIVTLPNHSMHMIAPMECKESPTVNSFLESLLLSKDNPINSIHYVNLRESMRNGGGPACLRLRIVLTETEFNAIHHGVVLTSSLYQRLTSWVNRHYRDKLHPEDLADPQLTEENQRALDELTSILQLGSIYAFQR